MAASVTQQLSRHKALVGAAGVLLVAYLYLRNRTPATAVAGTTDPTALTGSLPSGGDAGTLAVPAMDTSTPTDASALAAALEGLNSGLTGLATQQAQDEAAIQDAQTQAAQAATSWQQLMTAGSVSLLTPTGDQFTLTTQNQPIYSDPATGVEVVPQADTFHPYQRLATGPEVFSASVPAGYTNAPPVGYAAPASMDPFGTFALDAMIAAAAPTLIPDAKRSASSPTPAATVPTARAPLIPLVEVSSPKAVVAAQPVLPEYHPTQQSPARSDAIGKAIAV